MRAGAVLFAHTLLSASRCEQEAIDVERHAHEEKTAREKGSNAERVKGDADVIAAERLAEKSAARGGCSCCTRAFCGPCRSRGDASVYPVSELSRNPLMHLNFLAYDKHLRARERIEQARSGGLLAAESTRGKSRQRPPQPQEPRQAAFGPDDAGKSLRISGDTVEVDGARRVVH